MEIQYEQDIIPQHEQDLFPARDQEPLILADVKIETLAIDGICGVY